MGNRLNGDKLEGERLASDKLNGESEKSSGKRLIGKISLWIGSLLLIVFILGFVALHYGVDIALKSLQLDTDAPAVATPDQPPVLSVTDGDAGQRSDKELEQVEQQLPDDGDGQHSGNPGLEQDAQQRPPFQQDEDVPQFADGHEQPYTGEITPEKIEQAQEKITLSEKAKVASTLLKRLDPSDIKRLMSMNGMTIEEKKEAKQLFLEKLSEEEYDELIAIAAKLGLSQGQSYADSIN